MVNTGNLRQKKKGTNKRNEWGRGFSVAFQDKKRLGDLEGQGTVEKNNLLKNGANRFQKSKTGRMQQGVTVSQREERCTASRAREREGERNIQKGLILERPERVKIGSLPNKIEYRSINFLYPTGQREDAVGRAKHG